MNRWNWLILACWHKFTQLKRWLKILGLSFVKNGCGQSGDGTLKLTLSEKWTDGINWFFACSYRSTKIKSWSKIFCVGIIKNRCDQSDHQTLKLTVSQKWTVEQTDFLHVGTNSGKLKVDSTILGCAWSKVAMAFLFMRYWNPLYLKNEFMNLAAFLNADSDAVGFD